MIRIRRSHERGHADHGWLDTRHTFSFADYHDPEWMGFRSLRVINDDRIAPGRGFGTHPHRDMEIVSYVLSGALEHRDSMGNGRVIRPGEFQYMSAGTGVLHSEFNPLDGEPSHFLQIWIAPDRKGAHPRYAEKSFRDAAPDRLHLAASPDGRDGSIEIRQDAALRLVKLDDGGRVVHVLAPGRGAWVHVAAGAATLNGERLESGDGAAVTGEPSLEIAGLSPAQVILFDLK
jgi:quercetin 2,3-dioxygenase